MNQSKLSFLSLILALIIAFATVISPVGAADNISEDLLILGDSISTGYGLAEPDTDSYGAKLAEAMDLPEPAYLNLARDGATSGQLRDALSSPEAAAIISEFGTIVLSIGGNDILGPFFALAKQALELEPDAPNQELPTAFAQNPNAITKMATALFENQAQFAQIVGDFADNIAEIIDLIKAAAPKAQIYVQTIYDPFGGVPGFEMLSAAAGIILSQMNGAIFDGAETGGYIIADIAALFEGAALLYTNISDFDIHPNAAGHNLIFEQIYAAMQKEPDEPVVFINLFWYIG